MKTRTITMTLEGDIQLYHYAEAVRRFANIVSLLTREVATGIEIRWILKDLKRNNGTARIVGEHPEGRRVEDVVHAFERVTDCIQKRERIPYSQSIAFEAMKLVRLIGPQITAIRFEMPYSTALLSGDVEQVIDLELSGPLLSLGTVKGYVQSITNRGGLQFTLYDAIYDEPVHCYVKPEEAELLRDIWARRVHVTGRVTRDAETARVVKVTDITEIHVETIKGSYKRARGLLYEKVPEEPAEMTIRRIRDGED
jgi:hypothetical protein